MRAKTSYPTDLSEAQWVKVSEDRHPPPSAAIRDRQSVKHTALHSNVVGDDDGGMCSGKAIFYDINRF